MAQHGEFKDPFNFGYFLALVAAFLFVPCLPMLLMWGKILSA